MFNLSLVHTDAVATESKKQRKNIATFGFGVDQSLMAM